MINTSLMTYSEIITACIKPTFVQQFLPHGALLLFFSYFVDVVTYVTTVNTGYIFMHFSGMAF